MIVFNFSHKLTEKSEQQLVDLINIYTETENPPQLAVYPLEKQYEEDIPFAKIAKEAVDELSIHAPGWEELPFLIVPPSLNFAAVAILAEIHGRVGHFPSVVRTRKMKGTISPEYEVVEILNLQEIRDQARPSRFSD